MPVTIKIDGRTIDPINMAVEIQTVPLLDVDNFGAIPNDKAASAANVVAFNKAFAQAKISKAHVISRKAKQYWFNSNVICDSVTWHQEADLWFSDGTETTNCGTRLMGNGPKLNLEGSINSDATRRGGGAWGHHGLVIAAADFEVFGGGLIQGQACVSILCQAAKRGLIKGIRSKNTKADSFHNTCGTEWVTWEDCVAEGGGDDMMAVVSYDVDRIGTTYVTCHHITIRRFRGVNNRWARGLSVVGGQDILWEDCFVQNVNGFGLYIASESSYNTRGVKNVTARRVSVDVCGLQSVDLGDGLRIFGRGGVDTMGLPRTVDNVVLDGVVVNKPRRHGALVNTTYSSNIQRVNFSATNVTGGSQWTQIA